MNIDTKTYFTIMSIVMLVVGILWCCTIVGLLWGIPIIIGAQKMKAAENMSHEQLKQNNVTLLVWAIIFGVFASPAGIIAIVFAILVYNMIEKGTTESKVDVIIEAEPVKDDKTEEIKKRLEELERYRENGIITEEEYKQKRKEILGL